MLFTKSNDFEAKVGVRTCWRERSREARVWSPECRHLWCRQIHSRSTAAGSPSISTQTLICGPWCGRHSIAADNPAARECRPHQGSRHNKFVDLILVYSLTCVYLIGPILYGAIAVPSVTRCRCRCCCCCCRWSCRCGHRFYIHQVSLLSHAACAIAIAAFCSSW